MAQNFEIRIGKSISEAWQSFIKFPEIYVVLTAAFACSFVLGKLPLIGSWISLLLGLLLGPAISLIAHRARTNGIAEFSDLKLLIQYLPQLLAVGIIGGILVSLGLFFLLIPGVYLLVSYIFAFHFVLFRESSFWVAMEQSRKLVAHNWLGVFGLCFVAFCISLCGLLFLGIGILVSLPVSWLMLYHAFWDIQSQLE